LEIAKFPKNITQNKEIVIYVDGNQTRDFISINDVIESFGCEIKLNANGIYNIASGVSISIN
jgi:UDP-glucose 4-epimerase